MLAVKGSDVGRMSLIGFNPGRLNAFQRGRAPTQRTSVNAYVKFSCSIGPTCYPTSGIAVSL